MPGTQNKTGHSEWSTGDRTIVVVDDNPDDGYLISRQLKIGGVGDKVQLFDCANEARTFLSEHPASVLVVALNNRSETGFELLNWVRSQPELQRMMIVAAGESARAGDVQRAYDLGVNAYYAKGLDFNGFPDVLKELVFIRR